jgi:hypothetical protein
MTVAFAAQTAAVPAENVPVTLGVPGPIGSPNPSLTITEGAGTCGGSGLTQGNVQYPDGTQSASATSTTPASVAQVPVGLKLTLNSGAHPGPGYFATATISGNAANEVVTMNALNWTSTATQFLTNCAAPTGIARLQFSAANQTATATVSEHNNVVPGNFTLINTCAPASAQVQMAGVAVPVGPSIPMTNLTLTITSGGGLSGNGCSLFVTDNVSPNPVLPQAELDVVQGSGSGTITIP